MTFRQRLPYYLVGLFIGVVIVNFVLTKKGSSFDYWPNARVLKSIRNKPIIFSSEVMQLLNAKKIDSLSINQILHNGDVDISNKVKLDSCMKYNIHGEDSLKNITLSVKRCKHIAYLEKVTIK
jgi:hypothetical protein